MSALFLFVNKAQLCALLAVETERMHFDFYWKPTQALKFFEKFILVSTRPKFVFLKVSFSFFRLSAIYSELS